MDKTILDTKVQAIKNTNMTALRNAMKAYVEQGGINRFGDNRESAEWSNVRSNIDVIDDVMQEYENFNKTLSCAVMKRVDGSDVRDVLNEIQTKGQELEELQSLYKKKQQNLEISQSRQQSLEKASTNQSFVQGIAGATGFTHPLKPSSVPILLGIGFFILFSTALIVKDYFTVPGDIADARNYMEEIKEYMSSTAFRYTLIGIVIGLIGWGVGVGVYFSQKK